MEDGKVMDVQADWVIKIVIAIIRGFISFN